MSAGAINGSSEDRRYFEKITKSYETHPKVDRFLK
jgi:hypothetical protein